MHCLLGLDQPFLLLPFRPTSDPSAVRTFIRNFFDNNPDLQGEALAQELRMYEPIVSDFFPTGSGLRVVANIDKVIAGVIKWCWSRLQGGVVGWDAYELFKIGEYGTSKQ